MYSPPLKGIYNDRDPSQRDKYQHGKSQDGNLQKKSKGGLRSSGTKP
jgi:hypothetical protein